ERARAVERSVTRPEDDRDDARRVRPKRVDDRTADARRIDERDSAGLHLLEHECRERRTVRRRAARPDDGAAEPSVMPRDDGGSIFAATRHVNTDRVEPDAGRRLWRPTLHRRVHPCAWDHLQVSVGIEARGPRVLEKLL